VAARPGGLVPGVRQGLVPGLVPGGRLNIGQLTDVSHCKLQQNFSCNRLHQRAG
jgi:hypothetical protein